MAIQNILLTIKCIQEWVATYMAFGLACSSSLNLFVLTFEHNLGFRFQIFKTSNNHKKAIGLFEIKF